MTSDLAFHDCRMGLICRSDQLWVRVFHCLSLWTDWTLKHRLLQPAWVKVDSVTLTCSCLTPVHCIKSEALFIFFYYSHDLSPVHFPTMPFVPLRRPDLSPSSLFSPFCQGKRMFSSLWENLFQAEIRVISLSVTVIYCRGIQQLETSLKDGNMKLKSLFKANSHLYGSACTGRASSVHMLIAV